MMIFSTYRIYKQSFITLTVSQVLITLFKMGRKSKSQKVKAEEKTWIVEDILSSKEIKGKKFYEVKWKGWKDSTWEPKENLESCPDLIAEFEQNSGWEVERIVGKKVFKDRTLYLVKWKGYAKDQNTWEPITNLDCPELIKKFEISFKKQQERKSISASQAKTSSSKTSIKNVKTEPSSPQKTVSNSSVASLSKNKESGVNSNFVNLSKKTPIKSNQISKDSVSESQKGSKQQNLTKKKDVSKVTEIKNSIKAINKKTDNEINKAKSLVSSVMNKKPTLVLDEKVWNEDEIEKICNKKVVRGEVRYFVKFKDSDVPSDWISKKYLGFNVDLFGKEPSHSASKLKDQSDKANTVEVTKHKLDLKAPAKKVQEIKQEVVETPVKTVVPETGSLGRSSGRVRKPKKWFDDDYEQFYQKVPKYLLDMSKNPDFNAKGTGEIKTIIKPKTAEKRKITTPVDTVAKKLKLIQSAKSKMAEKQKEKLAVSNILKPQKTKKPKVNLKIMLPKKLKPVKGTNPKLYWPSKAAKEVAIYAARTKINCLPWNKGTEIVKILNATKSKGVLRFKVKFAGLEQLEYIPAKLVYYKYPQLTIKFFEKLLYVEKPKF